MGYSAFLLLVLVIFLLSTVYLLSVAGILFPSGWYYPYIVLWFYNVSVVSDGDKVRYINEDEGTEISGDSARRYVRVFARTVLSKTYGLLLGLALLALLVFQCVAPHILMAFVLAHFT